MTECNIPEWLNLSNTAVRISNLICPIHFNSFNLLTPTKLCLVYSSRFKQALDNQNTYTLPPVIPAEVLNFLQFQQIWILLLQTALSLPCQHPYTAPSVPKELHTWVTENRLCTLTAQAQKEIHSVLSWQY